MNMRIIVWGTGNLANEYMKRKYYHFKDHVVAFVDNNKENWGKSFWGINIISPEKLEEFIYDKLIICTFYYSDILAQINKNTQIDPKKIMTYFDLEESIKTELIQKYDNSSDADMKKVMTYFASHSLNIFGFYQKDTVDIYPVNYDYDDMPYILFEGKKMFYPRTYQFSKSNNIDCVEDILFEQGEHSPHRYIKSNDVIRKGMVIVDAGVCEGNFALRYVEEAKRIYLIEADSEWLEALKRTFAPYSEKVVFCDKYLSGKDDDDTITLDTLINEKIDILKMDIEGCEVDALKGGKRVLSESNAYCAVCSYHKHGDEQKIRNLLHDYGYRTDNSEGYMFFPYDTCLELRRGVIYGVKDEGFTYEES